MCESRLTIIIGMMKMIVIAVHLGTKQIIFSLDVRDNGNIFSPLKTLVTERVVYSERRDRVSIKIAQIKLNYEV